MKRLIQNFKNNAKKKKDVFHMNTMRFKSSDEDIHKKIIGEKKNPA